MRLLVTALLLLCAASAVAQSAPQCSGMDTLIGHWESDPDPANPGVTGWTDFSRDVQGKVVVRRNHADYPATKDGPASVHDDLMVIYDEASGQQRRAIYWDNEGHIIRYAVTASPDGCRLTFASEPGEPGPRFRLIYEQRAAGVEAGRFEIAPPGAASNFRMYRQWTMSHPGAKSQ